MDKIPIKIAHGDLAKCLPKRQSTRTSHAPIRGTQGRPGNNVHSFDSFREGLSFFWAFGAGLEVGGIITTFILIHIGHNKQIYDSKTKPIYVSVLFIWLVLSSQPHLWTNLYFQIESFIHIDLGIIDPFVFGKPIPQISNAPYEHL